jgi:hypothetical protein
VSFLPIHQALDAQVQTVQGLPVYAPEGTPNKPGAAFCRGTLLPAQTELPTFDGKLQRRNGKFQIDVFTKSSSGYEDAYGLTDTIIAAFVPTTDLTQGSTTVRVLNSYPIAVPNNTPGYYRVSVIVEWESWV